MARKRRKLIVRDRKKTFVRIVITCVSLIALIGIAFLAFFTAKSCGIKMTTRSLALNPSDMAVGSGDGIMYIRGGNMNFMSFDDEDDDFSKPLTGSSAPKGLVGTDNIKAVYSENTVQIIGGGFDIGIDGSIIALRCGSSTLAVCYSHPNGDETLSVYTSAGQLLKSFDFSGGRLVDFGYSEASGTTLWIMELDTDSGSPRTTVSTFDLDRMSSTGVITVSGQLVERIFFTNSSVFVVGTESLIRYSSSANREIYRILLYGYRVADISLAGDSPLLLLMPRCVSSISDISSLRLLTVSQKDVADETAVTVTLPEDAVSCHLTNGNLAVISSNAIGLYSGKGVLLEEKSLPLNATNSSKKLDEHHILMERNGEAVLLTVGK